MPRRFQFRIIWLFALTTLVALEVWAVTGEPSRSKGWAVFLLSACLPAILVAGTESAGHYGRVFCLAALVPAVIGLLFTLTEFLVHLPYARLNAEFIGLAMDNVNTQRGALAIVWILIPATGLLGVASRWFFRRLE